MLRTAEAFTNAASVEGFEGVLLASTFAGMQRSLGERVQGSGPELGDSNGSLRDEMKKGRRAETLRGRGGGSIAEPASGPRMALRSSRSRVVKSLKEQQSSLFPCQQADVQRGNDAFKEAGTKGCRRSEDFLSYYGNRCQSGAFQEISDQLICITHLGKSRHVSSASVISGIKQIALMTLNAA